MKDFSFKTRNTNIETLKNSHFDLLIIGGGITGAGAARDAAQRGLKVALVEAHDFAFGTSSRSSKLVHGGIRYLENLEFNLVFEALSERTKLFEMAPHLSHPLRFMLPLYKSSRVGMFKMGLGMWLYDALSLFQAPELHERLNARETIERMPIVQTQELEGSFVYSDGYMDDDRLVHETLRSANEFGAVCANYVKVLKSKLNEQNKVCALVVKDELNQQEFEISCEHVICSAGPWTDLVGEKVVQDWKKILRPTKGIHITLSKERLPLTSAVVMAAEKSNRIVFAIPRHEMVIIGTTDTDFKEHPEKATVTTEDIKYLLHITNQYFPGAQVTEKDIIASYVGVRPLVKDESDDEGKTSREHVILNHETGFTFIAGGKYTTYRLMSEQVIDAALKSFEFNKKALLKKPHTAEAFNPYTNVDSYQQAQLLAQGPTQKHLASRYGMEYQVILDRFGYTDQVWSLEAYQAIHTTMCLNLIDFYTRRVPLFLAYPDHGLSVLEEVSEVFKSELNWSESEKQIQLKSLKEFISLELNWKSL